MTDSVAECVQLAYGYCATGPAFASFKFQVPLDVYGKPIKPLPPYPTLDGLPVDEYNATKFVNVPPPDEETDEIVSEIIFNKDKQSDSLHRVRVHRSGGWDGSSPGSGVWA